jgi:hypothetical protein
MVKSLSHITLGVRLHQEKSILGFLLAISGLELLLRSVAAEGFLKKLSLGIAPG